jgi:glyoxylase I family protein
VRIEGIHHSSVVVTDLERARAFYRDVLGLEEVPAPPTFHFRVVWLQIGDQQIHLLHAPQPDVPGARHVALYVDDPVEARRRLAAAGFPVEETVPIPGADRFFTRDPDGNRIELIHWERPWPQTVAELGLRLT